MQQVPMNVTNIGENTMKINELCETTAAEMTSASIATSMGSGNGFVNGGIGSDPIRRGTKPKKKSKVKNKKT